MRDLATQASNGTNNTEDTASLNKEYEALKSEIDRIADKTSFNGIKFLSTDKGGAADIKVQLSDASGDTMTIDSLNAKTITTGTLTTLADRATAETEITKLDTAIQKLLMKEQLSVLN